MLTSPDSRAARSAAVLEITLMFTSARWKSAASKYLGFRTSVAELLGVYETSLNGPAPTGWVARPAGLAANAVGLTISPHLSAKSSGESYSGELKLSWTTYLLRTVTDWISVSCGASSEAAVWSRRRFSFTASASKGVPSVK